MTKVNGPKNRALVKRLNVNAYPAILYLRDGQMREYEEARSVARLAAFGRKAWRDVKPVPFYRAPNNWFGRVGGLLSRVPGNRRGRLYLAQAHARARGREHTLPRAHGAGHLGRVVHRRGGRVRRPARRGRRARLADEERRGRRRRLRAVAGRGALPPHGLLRHITTRTRSNGRRGVR